MPVCASTVRRIEISKTYNYPLSCDLRIRSPFSIVQLAWQYALKVCRRLTLVKTLPGLPQIRH
jgi:hypothetical protein